MKVILIPVSGRPECATALDQAFRLAQQSQSTVIGYHLKPPSNSEINYFADNSRSIVTVDSYMLAWQEAIKNKDHSDAEKAQGLFNQTAQEYNYGLSQEASGDPCAMWFETSESPDWLFSVMGPTADLIVVSRPASKTNSIAKILIYSAIINTATPVLILPHDHTANLNKRISIAWNQSIEAMSAVKAALPLLVKADEVNIITHQPESEMGPKLNQLLTYLKHWNITAKQINIADQNISNQQAILTGYQQSNSDLLVMGAYSHSRMRERILGGVTEFMLNKVDIPVFMLHT